MHGSNFIFICVTCKRENINLRFARHIHNIAHQSGSVYGRNHDINLIDIINAHIPGNLNQATLLLGIIGQDIGTIRTVYGNTAATCDITDYRVAGNRVAAARQLNHDAFLALNEDTVAGLSLGLARLQLCQHLRQILGGFQLLLFFIDFHQLGHNGVQRNTAVAQCCQQIFICIDADFAACFLQLFRRHQHLRLVTEAFNLTLQHFTALDDIFLTALLLEPAFDFVACIGRAYNINPVTARAVGLLGGDNLYDIAVLQLVVKRYNASVDLGTYAAVAYIRMDAVSEVNRHTAYRQVDNITARRKDKDFIGKDIHLDRVDKVARIIHILMPFQQLTQPAEFGIKAPVTAGSRLAAAAFLIAPVRSDTVFADAVHLKGADLDFQRLTAIGQHCCMQGLIHIGFRHRYIVLEAARNRTPHAVYNTQRAVAVLNGVYQHTNRQQIINFA